MSAAGYESYVRSVWAQQSKTGLPTTIPDGLAVSLLHGAYLLACERFVSQYRRPFVEVSATPPRTIVRALAEIEGARASVPPCFVLSPLRTKAAVCARQRSWARLRAMGYSFPAIGRAYGRDHTTIMHGLRRQEEGQ